MNLAEQASKITGQELAAVHRRIPIHSKNKYGDKLDDKEEDSADERHVPKDEDQNPNGVGADAFHLFADNGVKKGRDHAVAIQAWKWNQVEEDCPDLKHE